jgi:hypothetical protein
VLISLPSIILEEEFSRYSRAINTIVTYYKYTKSRLLKVRLAILVSYDISIPRLDEATNKDSILADTILAVF